MKPLSEKESSVAIIIIMGATGTGKSTFINLLTDDDKIRIGHNQQSETFGVQTAHYIDQTGCPIMLIDTPGFDDSREGVTDTDLLEKIVQFLEPENGDQIRVNGIIYMHRISDPRVSGISRKNIKMFHSLCGEANLENVRIVTTNWGRVSEEEGDHRETDLKQGAFKALIDAGAEMRRHTNTLASAQQIISELVPFKPVMMKIQEEVRDGKKLVDTAAGRVLAAEMLEMKKKHERELADLKREIDNAEQNKDRALRAELEQEHKVLEEQMERASADRRRLEVMLAHARSPVEQGKHEMIARPQERKGEVSGVLETLPAQCEDLTNPQSRPPKKRYSYGDYSPTLERPGVQGQEDTIALDELLVELARERKAQLQLIEKNTARMLENKETELHMERLKREVQRLEAEIRVAEVRKEAAAKSRSKKLKDGLYAMGNALVRLGGLAD